jgi:uncharacterized MAPEG superfamily protein
MPTAGPYGHNSGTSEGPGTGSQDTAVTKIEAWKNSNYIFGLKLWWGESTSCMYGYDAVGTHVELVLEEGEYVKGIKYHLEDGYLRGLRFIRNDGYLFNIGYLNDDKPTAFDDKVFTDMVTKKGTLSDNNIVWQATFYYVNPPMPLYATLACPSLGVMAHTAVVARSLMKVGKLRSQLGIKAPSCEPPPGTDPDKVQLWYRTFRAQENCKEMFLVYLPSILIASTMGYHAFGKWAPHAVGTLSLVGAFFRYKYLNAYIEDADKRGKPFYYAGMCMKPVFFLAVVSSGYLIGKELYHCWKKGKCCGCGSGGSSSRNDDDEKTD